MYRGSAHYKDACEIGRIEYASMYRTLLLFVKAKQNNMNLGEYLYSNGIRSLILVCAGDTCELIKEELKYSKVNICCILENNIKKYGRMSGNYPIRSFSELTYDDINNNYFVILQVNKCNEIIMELQKIGVDIDKIISIEEILSGLIKRG